MTDDPRCTLGSIALSDLTALSQGIVTARIKEIATEEVAWIHDYQTAEDAEAMAALMTHRTKRDRELAKLQRENAVLRKKTA